MTEPTLVSTPRGDARVEVHKAKGKARALLALGHGAGGDVDAPDLTAVRDAAITAGVTVALITQPYRVAGRRSAAPAGHLDEAWLAALEHVPLRKLPLIVGGRSSGARVACRTAPASGAAGVVNLAFPLHPPGKPERSRDEELRACGVPALVVNGDSDPFGVPEAGPGVDLVIIPGARHDLRKDTTAVAAAVVSWLREHGWAN
jgi:uncharacterized protein